MLIDHLVSHSKLRTYCNHAETIHINCQRTEYLIIFITNYSNSFAHQSFYVLRRHQHDSFAMEVTAQNLMACVVVYSLCQHWSMLVKMTVTPSCLIKPQIYILVCNNGNINFLQAEYGIWIRGEPVVEYSVFMMLFCRLPKTYISQRIILWSVLIFLWYKIIINS